MSKNKHMFVFWSREIILYIFFVAMALHFEPRSGKSLSLTHWMAGIGRSDAGWAGSDVCLV